jgi:ATP-dependent Clp protease adaptor protein ClpS
MDELEIEQINEQKEDLQEPPRFKVIFFNDDFTTTDFVTDVVQSVFKRTIEEAERITNVIHTTGHAVVGTYTKEIAETKRAQVINKARAQEFPLRVECELD